MEESALEGVVWMATAVVKAERLPEFVISGEKPLTLRRRPPINSRLKFELQAPDFGFLASVSVETEFFIAARR